MLSGKGKTFAALAAGSGTATAWRHVTGTAALPAARFPKLHRALAQAKQACHAYVVIDTRTTLLIPCYIPAAEGRQPGEKTVGAATVPAGTVAACDDVVKAAGRQRAAFTVPHR